MRLVLAGVAAAGVLLGATQSVGAPLFEAFQSACVETKGEPAAVAAHAVKSGWMPMPDAMLVPLTKQLGESSFKAKDLRGWIRSDQSSMTLLIAARADFPIKIQATGLFCAAAAIPGGPEAGASLSAWTAVPAITNSSMGKGMVAYALTVSPDGAHREIPARVLADDVAALKALSDPGARVFFTQTDAQMTMLGQFSLEREL